MNILIAPNSFKECADSCYVAETLSSLLRKRFPLLTCSSMPVTDGGDGFLNVCVQAFALQIIHFEIPACFPDGNINVPVGYSTEMETLFIETADVFGLKTVPLPHRNPMYLSSENLGQLLQMILRDTRITFTPKQIVLGLGGSAINDYGCGVASVLGVEFLSSGRTIANPIPYAAIGISALKLPKSKYPIPIVCVSDVLVPLCGEGGTAGMFAEQKGASRSEIRTLNNLAMKLINLADNTKGMNLKTKPYGASGGLILGLSLCAQVEFQPASSFLLDTLGLKKMIALNDVIISGEGKFDLQTLHEKAPGLILGETLKQGKKCILICGSIDEKCRMRYKQNVRFIALSQYFSSATESIKNIDFGLERAVDEIAEFLLLSYNS